MYVYKLVIERWERRKKCRKRRVLTFAANEKRDGKRQKDEIG